MDDSEIKNKHIELGIGVTKRIFRRYLRKNYEHKLTTNNMMNLTADHMEDKLKWCQSCKNQNWDYAIFSDETVFSDFRKSKKIGTERYSLLSSKNLQRKVSDQCMGSSIKNREKKSLNYLFKTWILMLIEMFERKILRL